MEYLEAIQDAIKKGYGLEATHIKTISVNFKHDGESIWDGEVEVFEIKGHAEAKQAYGWGFKKDDGAIEFVTVLEKPPVDGPETAVKYYLKNHFKFKR